VSKTTLNIPSAELIIESSSIRAFSDADYSSAGLKVVANVSTAEVLIGVKGVPIEALIPNKVISF